ncbi:general substrate transporter [Aspergillus varians]
MSQEAVSTVSHVLRDHPPKPWYRDVGALRLYIFLFPGVLLVSATTGYEGSMLNGLQAVTTFKDFFHPTVAITGLINSSYWMGAIVAFPIAPVIANRWGRKSVIVSATVVMLIAAALQGAARNVGMFVVARILFGLSASSAGNCGPVLVAELAHPRDRKFLTALYNGLYYVGAIMAAWVTYGTFPLDSTYGWRIPSYLQGAVALINLVCILFCPESPRYLIAQGRQDEAHAVLANAHSNGAMLDPVVLAEMEEISLVLHREAAGASSWRGFFTSPVHRKRLFLLIFIGTAMNWSGNGLISYYLSRVLDTVGVKAEKDQTLINGILQIVSFVTCIVASWASNWVARRTQFLTSTAVMFISFLAVTVANSVTARDPNAKAASVAVVFFVVLFMCGYNWAFNPLAYAYPVEFLPYNIRVIGLSFLGLFCNLAGFFNTWVNPVGLQNITWRYYIVSVPCL